MKIQSVHNTQPTSFKAIRSKEFLKFMKKEVKELTEAGNASEVEKISEMFEKVQSSILDFEIYSPKVKPRDKGKKIIPNKTIVWADSTNCPTLYKYNKLAPRPLKGKVAYNRMSGDMSLGLPYEEILTGDGWATGVGYITSNQKFPPTKQVLKQILFWDEVARDNIRRNTPNIDEFEIAKKVGTDLQDKLSKLLK